MRLIFFLALVFLLAACSGPTTELTSEPLQTAEIRPLEILSTPLLESSRIPSPGSSTETSASTPVASPATSQPTSSVPTPASVAQADGEPVIVFQQEGGLMGVIQTWNLYTNGVIASEQDFFCQVEPEAIASLLKSAEEIGFFAMPLKEAPDICCDFFTFTLTMHSEQKSNTIIVSEGDPNLPQDLRELLNSIQRTIYSCSD